MKERKTVTLDIATFDCINNINKHISFYLNSAEKKITGK
jgi:hypothetical protein